MRNQNQKSARVSRVRAKILKLGKRPRLTVFRSNRAIYAQIIDDTKGKTLVAVSQKEIKNQKGLTKTQIAETVGVSLAKKALAKKVKEVVFDRGAFRYHGRVKALAEGARKGGLVF